MKTEGVKLMKKNIKTFYNIKQRGTIDYQILFCFLLFFVIISNRGGGGYSGYNRLINVENEIRY